MGEPEEPDDDYEEIPRRRRYDKEEAAARREGPSTPIGHQKRVRPFGTTMMKIGKMSFLIIKKFLKKCWTWLKHNWKAPFVVLAVLFTWVVLRRKNVAEQILKIREASYKAQIDEINRLARRRT